MKKTLLILAFTASLSPAATIVYDNSSGDTGNSIMYAADGYTEIGDRILLGGLARSITEAQIQMFNGGQAGTFDANLHFRYLDTPVGTVFGTFSLVGINADGVFTVTFSTGGILVPDEFVFLVEVLNPSAGVDLGLNLFNPPALGSSSNSSFIERQGSSYSSVTAPDGNFYFVLTADDEAGIPEPASVALMGVGLALLAIRRAGRPDRA
jgi:hypothetical protein